jgi:choline kinase
MKAVIIAAGTGSRLSATTEQLPKTLLPFGGGTLLSAILGNFASVGVSEFVVVVGFQSERIRSYCASLGLGSRISFVENSEWQRGNGLSVQLAREAVSEAPFLLSMSDHLVAPSALARLMADPSRRNLLLVDPRIGSIFDLPDATKVVLEGARITHIGKELTEYNAVDCGVFRLDHRFFEAMGSALRQRKESLSEGVRQLIGAGVFEGVLLPEGSDWIDIDTPEAYAHALAHRDRYLAPPAREAVRP